MGFIGLTARISLAVVFAVAAASKLRNPADFRQTLAELGFPTPILSYLWILLILTELAAALSLSIGLGVPAILLTGALLLTFAGSAIFAIRSGRDIRCACFGLRGEALGFNTFYRTALMVLALGGYGLAVLNGESTFWPSAVEDMVAALLTAIGVIMIGQWLLAVPIVASLISMRLKAKPAMLRFTPIR
jgi:uncharacterized membrane protein YphA (DoxX/SURF4 family)